MAEERDEAGRRPDPAKILAGLPDKPGVYIFRDGRGRPLYVGKASRLRRRVASYFRGRPASARISRMLEAFRSLDTILTDSDVEALSLENTLIKRHRPRYNVLLRDDKTYPYIKVTTGETWPRAFVTRRLRDDGHSYFGPFIPGGRARRTMQLLTRYFRIRTCSIRIDGTLPRPCLYYDLMACPGPCVEGLTTGEEYGEAVEEALLFLSGRGEELLGRLTSKMKEAAEREEFEQAAHFRDLIRQVEQGRSEIKTESVGGEDLDVFGLHEEAGDVALVVLVMRNGRVIDRRQLFWERQDAFDPAGHLQAVIPQYYSGTDFLPAEIHLGVEIDAVERRVIEAWLGERSGRRVRLLRPHRGEKRRRVLLAEENARGAHRVRFRSHEEKDGLRRLARLLRLPEPPGRIEGFDVSHLQGRQTFASLVVFDGGRPRPADYRLFSIRDASNDDFASMAEAVRRRYQRLTDEGGLLPDLILIDGGSGQLAAASGALARVGLDLPVVSLAKREEEVFVPGRQVPLRLDRNDAALKLLQRVRDEAHRFALGAHRRRRGRQALGSGFDGLAGLGPVRIRRLLETFGSAEAAARASVEELEVVLGPALAKKIAPQLSARFGLAGETPPSTPGPTSGENG